MQPDSPTIKKQLRKILNDQKFVKISTRPQLKPQPISKSVALKYYLQRQFPEYFKFDELPQKALPEGCHSHNLIINNKLV